MKAPADMLFDMAVRSFRHNLHSSSDIPALCVDQSTGKVASQGRAASSSRPPTFGKTIHTPARRLDQRTPWPQHRPVSCRSAGAWTLDHHLSSPESSQKPDAEPAAALGLGNVCPECLQSLDTLHTLSVGADTIPSHRVAGSPAHGSALDAAVLSPARPAPNCAGASFPASTPASGDASTHQWLDGALDSCSDGTGAHGTGVDGTTGHGASMSTSPWQPPEPVTAPVA